MVTEIGRLIAILVKNTTNPYYLFFEIFYRYQ